MAHEQQQDFFRKVKENYPRFFKDVKVLDIGSLDINGNTKHFFEYPFFYIGVDLAPGRNVDVVCPAHLFDSGYQFDVVTSAECFEHDMYWVRTLQNMIRLLKPGGLMFWSCASDGRAEHGTLRTSPQDAPLLEGVSNEWANYYKNLNSHDIEFSINVRELFVDYQFLTNDITHDLYFVGIKK